MEKLQRKDMIEKVDETHYFNNVNGAIILVEDWYGFRIIEGIRNLADEKQESLFNTEHLFYILDFTESDNPDYYLLSKHVGIELIHIKSVDDDYKSDLIGYVLYQLGLITKEFFDEVSIEEYSPVE